MSIRLNASLTAVLGSVLLVSACGGSRASSPQGSASAPAAASRANVSLDKNSYPVFSNPDAGADPSVPAEQGGKGFTGAGWETNSDFDLIGDPRALKGGTFTSLALEFRHAPQLRSGNHDL